MNTAQILQAIDDQIARLSTARALLAATDGKPIHKPWPGNKSRKLSPATRKKIAAAMRARWAATRKCIALIASRRRKLKKKPKPAARDK